MTCAPCEAVNEQEWAAFASGQFHTAYGLLAIAGIAIAANFIAEQHHWLLYLLTFGLAIGILVDLWVNGYEH